MKHCALVEKGQVKAELYQRLPEQHTDWNRWDSLKYSYWRDYSAVLLQPRENLILTTGTPMITLFPPAGWLCAHVALVGCHWWDWRWSGTLCRLHSRSALVRWSAVPDWYQSDLWALERRLNFLSCFTATTFFSQNLVLHNADRSAA